MTTVIITTTIATVRTVATTTIAAAVATTTTFQSAPGSTVAGASTTIAAATVIATGVQDTILTLKSVFGFRTAEVAVTTAVQGMTTTMASMGGATVVATKEMGVSEPLASAQGACVSPQSFRF